MPCSVRFKVATSGKYQESVRFLESTRKVSVTEVSGKCAAESWLPHRFRDEASLLAVVTAHGGFGIRFSLYFSDVTSAPPS